MNKILLTIALLSFNAGAAEINLGTFDPTKPGQQTVKITCDYPTQRADNSILPVADIAKVSFLVKKDNASYTPAGENTTECSQVYDLTKISDGKYTYVITATDTGGRESAQSGDWVTYTIAKSIAKPRAPTALKATVY